jgi:uncharacterized protein (DUF736 family)
MEIDLENLSGALFKNTYKVDGSNQPDFKGSFQDKNTREKVLDIAAWERTSQDGNTTYLSLSISEPFQKGQAPAASGSSFLQGKSNTEATTAAAIPVTDDDIPF